MALAPALLLGACAPRSTPPQTPMSVTGHVLEARRCNERAEEHEVRAREVRAHEGDPMAYVVCVDTALHPPVESGGKPLSFARPCWTKLNLAIYHEGAAQRLRAEARVHRRQATQLIATERRSCLGIGEDELSHTPFYHNEDILSVEALREDGTLRGAEVVFRKVRGLTAEWMSRASHCHMARAAVMGYAPEFMSYCPLMAPGLQISVEDADDRITVRLRSDRPDSAAIVLGRAEDLLRPQPASLEARP